MNLTGGTFTSNVNITKGAGSTTATLNFDGGTLRPGLNSVTFLQGLDTATVKSGGALIDTNGRNVTIAQPLLAGTPSGGLTKQGLGSLTLSGASTYSGATTVTGGALVVSGSLDTQTSTVTVASGATLGGTAINRPLNVAGGNVDPGNAPANAVGTMTTNASVAFGPGAAYSVQLAAYPNADLLTQAGGTINLANATLFASGISGFAAGPVTNVYTIVQATGGGSISGTFNGLADGALVPVNGELFTINYSPTAVTLTDTATTAAATVYVNDNWSNTAYGADPDGAGIVAAQFGISAFSNLQAAIDAVSSGGTIIVEGGTYPGAVNVNKPVNLQFVVDTVPLAGPSAETIANLTGPVTLNAVPSFLRCRRAVHAGPRQLRRHRRRSAGTELYGQQQPSHFHRARGERHGADFAHDQPHRGRHHAQHRVGEDVRHADLQQPGDRQRRGQLDRDQRHPRARNPERYADHHGLRHHVRDDRRRLRPRRSEDGRNRKTHPLRREHLHGQNHRRFRHPQRRFPELGQRRSPEQQSGRADDRRQRDHRTRQRHDRRDLAVHRHG